MTLERAKERLEEKIQEMESNKNPLSYAAIILDSKDPSNYLLEYGITDFTGPFITEDKVHPLQKGTYQIDNRVIVLEEGTDESKVIFNRTSTPFGNLLSAQSPMKEKVRPLKAGLSVSDKKSTIKSGTIGGLFTVQEDDSIYLLSNMHVLSYFDEPRSAEVMSCEHNIIVQPSRRDGAKLRYPDNGLEIGKTVSRAFNGLVDFAVAKLDDGVEGIKGFFNGKNLCRNYYESDVKLGEEVYKYGRTTGYTEGTILSTNAAIKIKNIYNSINGFGQFIIFRDQIMTNNMAEGGDSGSLLIGPHRYPIGLTFADINFIQEEGSLLFKMHQENPISGRTFHNKLESVFVELSQEKCSNSINKKLTFKSFIT